MQEKYHYDSTVSLEKQKHCNSYISNKVLKALRYKNLKNTCVSSLSDTLFFFLMSQGDLWLSRLPLNSLHNGVNLELDPSAYTFQMGI